MEIIYFGRKGMNKKWEFFSHDQAKVVEISEKFNISELLATVLVNRNIVEDKDVELFLNPTRNDFPGKTSRDLLQHVSRPESPPMAREQ